MSSETLDNNNSVEKKSVQHSQKITELQEDLEEIVDKINSGEINPDLKLPEEGEVIAEFIDSEGEKRKPSQEIALLGPEHVRIIDTFFREHDILADSVETMLSFAQDVTERLGTFNNKDLLTQTLTSIAESDSRDIEATNAPELPKVQELELTAGIDKISRIKGELSEDNIPGNDYEEIKNYIDSYYASLPEDSRPMLNKLGFKARFSAKAREQALDEIRRYEDSIRNDKEYELNKTIRNVNDFIIDLLENEFNDQLAQLKDAVSNQLSADKSYNLQDLDPSNSPLQNQVTIYEIAEHIAGIYLNFEKANDIAAGKHSLIHNPIVQEYLKLLTPNQIAELTTSITESRRSTLERTENSKAANSFKRLELAAKAAVIEATKAAKVVVGKALYQENGLADLYISNREEQRIQTLATTINNINSKIGTTELAVDPEYIIQDIKSKDFPLLAANSVIFHGSGFIREIIESGELRTKQTQLEKGGVLHQQQTGTSGYTRQEIAMHSLSVHYSESPDINYLMRSRVENGQEPEEEQLGLVVVPLAKVVEHSPIDKFGALLTSVVAAPRTETFYTSDTAPLTDEVFYASPESEKALKFSIPLDSQTSILVLGDEEGSSQSSSGASIRTIAVPEATDPLQNLENERFYQIIRQEISRIAEDTQLQDRVVVPIRNAGVQYIVESTAQTAQGSGYLGRRGKRADASLVSNRFRKYKPPLNVPSPGHKIINK